MRTKLKENKKKIIHFLSLSTPLTSREIETRSTGVPSGPHRLLRREERDADKPAGRSRRRCSGQARGRQRGDDQEAHRDLQREERQDRRPLQEQVPQGE